MFNQKKRAMKLTQNEKNLFRSIAVAVLRAHWHNEKVVRKKIIESAKGLVSIYGATPTHLERMVNLYSANLTNEECHEAYLKILEIFLEMRADVLDL